MKSYPTLVLFLCSFFAATSLWGDEVTDAIDEAVASYKSGDYSNAASQLDYASALVRQMKAVGVVEVFCDALPGWTAEEAESNSAGAMMMGGGITAERSYRKGDSEVRVSLVMDSPMLQSVVMMISNPAMMTMTGGKLVKVQGIKGMLQDEGGSLTLSFVVNGNALITIEGYDPTTADDLKAYGECLNLKALE